MSYHVYVVELSKRVWQDNWRFREKNPQFNPVLECLYVGMSSKPPKIRFEQHKTRYKSKKGAVISSYFVEKYGLYLRPSLYKNYNPITSRSAALAKEKELTRLLRQKRYAVWSN